MDNRAADPFDPGSLDRSGIEIGRGGPLFSVALVRVENSCYGNIPTSCRLF